MIEAEALFVLAGVIALCMLILIGDWIRRRWIDSRQKRDLRVPGKPAPDPRTARHRNYAVGRDSK